MNESAPQSPSSTMPMVDIGLARPPEPGGEQDFCLKNSETGEYRNWEGWQTEKFVFPASRLQMSGADRASIPRALVWDLSPDTKLVMSFQNDPTTEIAVSVGSIGGNGATAGEPDPLGLLIKEMIRAKASASVTNISQPRSSIAIAETKRNFPLRWILAAALAAVVIPAGFGAVRYTLPPAHGTADGQTEAFKASAATPARVSPSTEQPTSTISADTIRRQNELEAREAEIRRREATLAAEEARRRQVAALDEADRRKQEELRKEAERRAEIERQQRMQEAERVRLAAQAEAERRSREEIALKEAQRRQEERRAGDQCDELAGNPNDRQRANAGSSYEVLKMRAAEAIDVCSRAVGTFPDQLRYQYQLARATQMMDRPKAFEMMRRLADQRYSAAFDNLGWLYFTLKQNKVEAVRRFQIGAQLGDPDCMVSLAEMIDKGAYFPADPAQEKIKLYRQAAELGHPVAQRALEAELLAFQQRQQNVMAQQQMQTQMLNLFGAALIGAMNRR